ncbi:VOC family protein [Kordiimonas laminariae]|uniref:VOC family protein n=1 Tax=Kordiimonas laminariae TaxID=2917717 RepID=UPI001FF6D77A|nr:VOC family protein [Kordiimonas laminariae]MCK0069610.1 VOC family protein [Kordiimonas laminariae]
MIGYTTVGANDLDKSAAFYDSVLAELGAKRTMEFDGFIVWGSGDPTGSPGFSITKPFDGNAASVGNGVMIALLAKDQDQVAAVYNKAIAEGGKCEGEPGFRGDPSMGFYAAYFRDLDGNKLNAFCMAPQG